MTTNNYKGNSSKIGVYSITNIINNKRYIGSTKSAFHTRKTKHINSLKLNKHFNVHLQNSYNKYGDNAFIFEILEVCENKDVEKKEAYYIKKYKSNLKLYGYNIANVKHYKFKYKQSKQAILNKSIYKRKKSSLDGHIFLEKGLNKGVNRYSLNGAFIKYYKSCKELLLETGWSKSSVSVTLNARKLYYKNNIIIFSNDILTSEDILFISNKYSLKKVYLYDLNLNFVKEFMSVKECCVFLKCKDAEVRMCCLGYRTKIKNYITKYNKI